MLIVQKYGGTSVADAECIKDVASRVVAHRERGDQVVVVVSARGDTTDELLKMAYEIAPSPPERELDMLLSAGERVSMALLGMAIMEQGLPAMSFTGSQAGIITDGSHTRAKIREVRAHRIKDALADGRVAIVAGFQGVSWDNRDVTTLGRGGSDTSAVALAAALGADACEIYTDVDGVYTADPRICPDARRLDAVSYDEMLEMAATGARVLQLRSVEYARNHGVNLRVCSSFGDAPGTLITEEERMERAIISGVTHDVEEAKITLLGVPDRPGIAATVFGALADSHINVDMILQNVSEAGHTDISFTLPSEDLSRGKQVIEQVVAEVGARGFSADETVAKVSLVGAGMRTHPGVAAKMFRVLAEHGINIEMISTSSIKISCVVSAAKAEEAVRALHSAFSLSEEAASRERA